ncbi:MAG: YidC/Oxa1 family insertase periplasmic-domain containing protein [Planctomycetia bacterium]|nr:YidC/Oxa1 family insertase periplasmic-domain containing protein [Planctomycetia bacterium]
MEAGGADPSGERRARIVPPDLRREIEGVSLLNEPWEIETLTETEVVFLRTVPKYDLEVRKRFALAVEEHPETPDAPGYRLDFSIRTRNVGAKERTVAYRFDGPNGLPTEAWWYSQKVSREWGQTLGVRDIVYGIERYEGYPDPFTIPARNVARGDVSEETELSLANAPLTYMGVDSVYFSVAMIPEYPSDVPIEEREGPFTKWRPVRYGSVEPNHEQLANASFVLTGKSVKVAPSDEASTNFRIFAGPKRSDLLDAYGLSTLLYFGWFSWISRLLLGIMHVVTAVCPYVVGILVLTVLVRMLIFPLSRVQAINSLKMQVIQPEMARIRERYANDPMAMRRAQAELFRKFNFRPQIGCLLIFIQLPIFMGLWRGVMLDVDARGESLLGRGIAWCSDLSAPDRMFAWDSWMPGWLSDGSGWLGPYFNLLPLFVIILFLWQQNRMMPTPTDDQGRMQQKMMKFMMIFMGFLFFKVPSGLCIYMVIVTFWGVCERHFLPKSVTHDPAILAAQANTTIDVRASDPKRRRHRSGKKKRRT